jgi:NADH dehydrogenase [ubiquinone] 1 alpha subcomplex assembly factor 7
MSGQIDTPLALKLKARIRAGGPIAVSDYMTACLHDPEYGYYRSQAAIGAAADFITAPEISQVFGELIGIWAAVAWRAMGAPPEVNLVELGPGRGTLMADALRAARIVPGFIEAARIHLVEMNSSLAGLQRAALAPYDGRTTWHDEVRVIADISRGDVGAVTPETVPMILLANEFLDTMPVEQWESRDNKWLLRSVGLADDQSTFVASLNHRSGRTPPVTSPGPDGTIWQTNDTMPRFLHGLRICARNNPLAALFIDYGFTGEAAGDTLQAMSGHKYVSPFRAPGLDDLTAHVDFRGLAELCNKDFAVDGPITQSEFLLKMGLAERTQALMAKARPDQINALETGARRIADPSGMGALFKVMAVRHNVPMLPPFARTA